LSAAYSNHASEPEHSAQIDPTLRARRETLFKDGKIDALVCTPTLHGVKSRVDDKKPLI
jgi:hypothetical protein